MQRGNTTSPGYGKRCCRAEKEDRSTPVVTCVLEAIFPFSVGRNIYSYSVAVIVVGVLAPRNVDLDSSK